MTKNAQADGLIHSVTGAMVALVTPMNKTGEVDWNQYQVLLEWHKAIKTPAVIIAGTTGESALLSQEETKKLWSMASQTCRDSETMVIAGTGSISPEQVMDNNQVAASVGVKMALVVTPYYLRLTQAALYDHFWTIADNSPIPILLYNVPSRTGNDLHTNTTKKLAKHPNIFGIKEAKSDMDRIKQLAQLQSFVVLSGDDGSFCQAMQLGADGVISVAANVRPLTLQQICHALTLGDVSKAQELDQSLQSLYELLGAEPNPGPIKAVMAAAKMLSSGIRRPLQLMSLNPTQLKPHLGTIKQEFTLR